MRRGGLPWYSGAYLDALLICFARAHLQLEGAASDAKGSMTMAHLFDAVANLVEYSRLPHLRRDRAGPCHICTRDSAHACHICTGTGLAPPTSAPGTWAHPCHIGTESSQPGSRIYRAKVLRSVLVCGVSPII